METDMCVSALRWVLSNLSTQQHKITQKKKFRHFEFGNTECCKPLATHMQALVSVTSIGHSSSKVITRRAGLSEVYSIDMHLILLPIKKL